MTQKSPVPTRYTVDKVERYTTRTNESRTLDPVGARPVRDVVPLVPSREHARAVASRVHAALARVREFGEGKAILDTLTSVQDLYRRQRAELVATNILAAARLETMRLLGHYLGKHVNHNGGRPNLPSTAASAERKTLVALGVTRNESVQFQKVAQVTADEFEALLARGVNGEIELTTRAVLHVYDATVGKEKRRAALQALAGNSVESAAEEDAPDSTALHDIAVYNADARALVSLGITDVDFIFTSPPYNVGEDYNTHDDRMTVGAYRQMMLAAYRACYAVMKPGARIGVVVPAGVTVGNADYSPLAARHFAWLERAGFRLLREIVWDKGAATAARRTSWGSWNSASQPNFRDRTERILFACKDVRKIAVPAGASLLTRQFFTALTQDVWQVSPARDPLHPAVFPPALVENAIRLFAFRGAHVLDPFAGTGTTGIVARRLGCRASLVEQDRAYCALIRQRLCPVKAR